MLAVSALGGNVLPPAGADPQDYAYLEDQLGLALSLNIPGSEIQMARMVAIDKACDQSIQQLSRLCLRSGRELTRRPYSRPTPKST